MGDPRATQYLLVYGTLATGELAGAKLELSRSLTSSLKRVGRRVVRGMLYDLGSYPGLVSGSGAVQAELYELTDPEVLELIDAYEGFQPGDPGGSLFVRRAVRVPRYTSGPEAKWFEGSLDAWIYYYNGPVEGRTLIARGSWREYRR